MGAACGSFFFLGDKIFRVGKIKPRIAITMGDPAGIGPEICIKAIATSEIREQCDAVIIGSKIILEQTADRLDLAKVPSVIDPMPELADFAIGTDAAETGRAAARYIETAVELWRRGEIDAIATAPISKKALSLAGYEFPGHTEFLAHLTGTERVGMSFFGGGLRVVLLSTHLSLTDAIKQVTKENLVELITFSDRELHRLIDRSPKLAVAGLNPHASEGGMFGHEESNAIAPAVDECRARGIDVSGPYSPDTIFLRCHRGEFDAVIALYHDQATIPVKAFAFGSAVNVTLGLPLIRTSVDHGTAFDIAGKGVADASSLVAAIKLAAELVKIKGSDA
jgi:4-phospho-D-threonate 3-dehydrogenase / 4-phospho-D-erythronate 3-dehydrogenase